MGLQVSGMLSKLFQSRRNVKCNKYVNGTTYDLIELARINVRGDCALLTTCRSIVRKPK